MTDRICVERGAIRSSTASGDPRPPWSSGVRIYGEDDDLDIGVWAETIAATIEAFCEQRQLEPVALERRDLVLPRWLFGSGRRWDVVTGESHRMWNHDEEYAVLPSEEFAFMRCLEGYEDIVFLLRARSAVGPDLDGVLRERSLDEATLLPHGAAILRFGTEWALLEACFRERESEAEFLQLLAVRAACSGADFRALASPSSTSR